MVERTPFRTLIDLDYPQGDVALHHALGERWWPSTQSFHFPVGEIGLTPLDFTAMTGMRFGGLLLTIRHESLRRSDAWILSLFLHMPDRKSVV